MDYQNFVRRICEDGRAAAQKDYARENQKDKRDGAVFGFNEAETTQSPEELATLLSRASDRMTEAHRDRAANYWYWRCRQAEIEWVANVLSATMLNAGLPVIVAPTARGMMKAAEILGVKSENRAALADQGAGEGGQP